MSSPNELETFVRDSLGRGLGREETRRALTEAGWPADEVAGALGAFADVEFPVPVPRPRPYLSARETFIYLVVFVLLYVWCIRLGVLGFLLIERWLPDVTQDLGARLGEWSEGRFASSIRWSIASILVGFPIYIWLSRRVLLAARNNPESRQSLVRKWLTYWTLFVAASVVLGAIVSLLYSFLSGELTTRFVLKLGVVVGIAGSVFGYYLWDIRQDDSPSESSPLVLRGFVGAVLVVVVFSLVMGFRAAGTPSRARLVDLDDLRTQDLARIHAGVRAFWRERQALPVELAELVEFDAVLQESIRDPSSGEAYAYRVVSDGRFEVCAVFETAGRSASSTESDQFRRQTTHPVGLHCIVVDATLDTSAD